MMWSQLLLCMLVGVAFASNNPAWKDNTEYIYQVRGRTLASLHEVADQYSGILLKAKLIIRPKSDGVLSARIQEAKYGQVHTQLPEGWKSDIPDSELSYKDLTLSNKPFEIAMRNGVVRDLIVDKEVPNWEANIIKSIVSQFQLDTKAENLIQSHVNTLPDDDSQTAVFKTMEETVTGKTETLYDIHLLPEHILESKPWLVPQPEMKGDGEYIEIVKSKNYSSSEQRPLYHYGLSGVGQWEPASNQMGQFFVRDSISRAILSGKLNRFTIQNTYTINKIVMSPTLDNEQKGSIISMLNVTLFEVRQQNGEAEKPSNPISLGSLVYRFNEPYESNQARPMKYQQKHEQRDSSEERLNAPSQGRFRRDIEQDIRNQEYDSSSSEENWQVQDLPKLSEAPETPLLPLTMGYKGNSIKKDSNINLAQSAMKIAQEIGQELDKPEELVKKDSLGKYSLLTSLTRFMEVEELQEVAKQLFTQSEEGAKRGAWEAYRDAVAECGTGPAFLTIQEWIQTQKIKYEVAAEILLTMAASVRQPTEEYMRAFYTLATKPEVASQYRLNDSAILAYTNLLRQVYVNKYQSHNQFPVHSFGSFKTEEGKNFMKETVIPYLTQQLHEAVSRADTHKIHVYIRALGNVAHRNILAAFEPYLEGKKQCSQFQRLMMVVALDKLVDVNPVLARSVLYKIYQNAGEAKEIRVAAVYQLMRTSPPTDMLQRMAQYTNIDTDEHVNAAVKSSIESAAELEGDEHHYLRSSARAAKPLLIRKEYGIQYGRNHLRSYVIDELNVAYKQSMHLMGSDDSLLPKGYKYSLRENIAGLRRPIVSIHAMLSSIDELTHVFQQQTESYKQHQQRAQQADSEKWSSQTIADLLNLKSDEREQLEGQLNFEIGSLQKLWTFDNQTIEQFPEVIRHLEELLKAGKSFRETKWINRNEIAISFPTEMGFPFLFAYDRPTLFHIEGKVQASANPQVSRDNKLHKPESVSSKMELRVTVSGKTHGRLTFVTPFDHQQYVSGYQQFAYLHLPIRAHIDVDVKNMQVKAEIESLEQTNVRLVHFSSWPYTSRSDITNLEPISQRPNTQYIRKETEKRFETILGDKHTGMAFRMELVHEQKLLNLQWFTEILRHHNPQAGLMSFLNAASIQHCEFNLYQAPEQSSARKFIVHLGYQHEYRERSEDDSNDSKSPLNQLSQVPTEFAARKQEFIKKVAPGINNAHVDVFDASIEFQGPKNIKYSFTAGLAKSNVDPKSKLIIYYKKTSDSQESQAYEAGFAAKNLIPNTNGLDLLDSLKHEPIANTKFELFFGKDYQSSARILGQVELTRSQERKQYLLEQPMYQQCKREMQEGNHQLPACANMTVRANFLDRAEIKLEHNNLQPEYLKVLKEIFGAARLNFFPTLEVNSESRAEAHQLYVQAKFFRDFEAVNVTVKTPEDEATFHNIRLNEWAQEVVAVHPVFHLRSRLIGKSLGFETYRPTCVVDQTRAATFNNRTYPLTLEKIWTVMLEYVPIRARQHYQQQHQDSTVEHLKRQVENYAVLVRANENSNTQKDVKITVNVPETKGKLLEITMTPSSKAASGYSGSNPSAKIFVNGREIKIDDKHSHDLEQGYVQIYALRNGEVKVEVDHVFYVIYDGSRVKITGLNGKFRESIRGLCGQFNDDKTTDLLTSENCVARDVRDFIESYQVEQGKQRTQQLRADNKQCYDAEEVLYANVISDRDAGREQKHQQRMENHSGMCTKYQTRYVEQNGEICFTTRPMPVCRCQQRGTINKNVAVHCVQKSNVAQLWKSQIDKGASPDFSHKKQTKTIPMELPQGCSN